MANRKRFIRVLSGAERAELEKAFKHGAKHRERQRAQAVLLSASGHDMNSLAARFGVNRDTINRWLGGWERHGLGGLREGPHLGRPPKIPRAAQKK